MFLTVFNEEHLFLRLNLSLRYEWNINIETKKKLFFWKPSFYNYLFYCGKQPPYFNFKKSNYSNCFYRIFVIKECIVLQFIFYFQFLANLGEDL